MEREVTTIIERYVESAKKKVRRKNHAWIALAWNLFVAEGGDKYADYAQILSCLPEDAVSADVALSSFLSQEEIGRLVSDVEKAMDHCCRRFDSQPFAYNALHHESKSLARLLVDIACPEEGDNIYLPFSGLGEIAVNLPDYAHVAQAEELDPIVWALGQMRLYVHRSHLPNFRDNTKWNFINRDSFAEMERMAEPLDCGPRFPEASTRQNYGPFNLIIMSPPSGRDPDKPGAYLHVRAIREAFRLLKRDGRMVVALPAAYVHHSSIRPLGEYLQAFGAFKSVRFITGANRPMVSDDFCVLEITRQRQDAVEFIDDETAVKIPSNQLVSGNLLPSFYIDKDEYEGEYIRLGDCLEEVGTETIVLPKMPMVGNLDLSEDYLDCTIDCEKLRIPTHSEFDYYKADEGVLIVNLLGKFRLEMFSPDKHTPEVCWCEEGIKVFRIREDKIMPDYLLHELTSEKMALRISENLNGKDMVGKVYSFLDLKIPLPTKEEQMRIVFEDARDHLTGVQAALVRAQDQHVIDIRLRKHTLLSNVGAYRNQWKTLRKALERNGGDVDLRQAVSRAYPDNFYEWMDGMEALFEEINRELKVLTDDKEDFGESLTVNPNTLISSYCDSKKSTFYRMTTVEETDPDVAISIPPKAIYRVFDNIVNNALSHGFTDAEREDYEIRFQTIAAADNVTILVANNGSPLSREIQPEGIFELGMSTLMYKDTHGGQGGYDIHRILSQYNVGVTVESHPEEEFTVVYKMTFKRKYEG